MEWVRRHEETPHDRARNLSARGRDVGRIKQVGRIRRLVSSGQRHCHLMPPRLLALSAACRPALCPCTPRDDAARGHGRTCQARNTK